MIALSVRYDFCPYFSAAEISIRHGSRRWPKATLASNVRRPDISDDRRADPDIKCGMEFVRRIDLVYVDLVEMTRNLSC
jgi:hypothetical protein